jgi:hypothetical protein
MTDQPAKRWPPRENCYCGGPEEIYPHRKGTGKHCRITPRAAAHEIELTLTADTTGYENGVKDATIAALELQLTALSRRNRALDAQLTRERQARLAAEAATRRVRALCWRGPGPANEFQIWTVDVLAALDAEQPADPNLIVVDRSDLTSALIPISRYIDRTPDDDTADHLTDVLTRLRAALDQPKEPS